MKDFWTGLVGFLNSLKDSVTVDQYMGFLRQIIPALGGFAMALGWVSPAHWAQISAGVLAAAGPTLLLVGIIWSAIANSQWSIRKAAAKLPENKPQ